jgi:predicted protein tyrosine phosphatase
MIESIIITDMAEAVGLSETDHQIKQNSWITILEPEEIYTAQQIEQNFKRKNVEHFYQIYYDWTGEKSVPIDINPSLLPQKNHMYDLICYLQKLIHSEKKYNLGINCHAGISRSTAAGAIAWYMQERDPIIAMSRILEVRDIAWPNKRMLELAQEIFGGNLLEYIGEWKSKFESYKEYVKSKSAGS